jgi:hypothetical protein
MKLIKMKPSELKPTEYFAYYKPYIDLVDDIPLIEALERGLTRTKEFFASIPNNKQLHQYAEGKWTPKEVLLHIIDTERVFSYRALYFARSEGSSVAGFDENIFGVNCEANGRSLDDLLKEYVAVRKATILLFESFSEIVLKRGGVANDNPLSVRAAGCIICGHEIHHTKVVEERYL